jgi:hypothetical protein
MNKRKEDNMLEPNSITWTGKAARVREKELDKHKGYFKMFKKKSGRKRILRTGIIPLWAQRKSGDIPS